MELVTFHDVEHLRHRFFKALAHVKIEVLILLLPIKSFLEHRSRPMARMYLRANFILVEDARYVSRRILDYRW